MRDRYLQQVMIACVLQAALLAEVQVNVRTSEAQANPAAATDGAGGAVVVWSSYFTSDGRSNEIFARRLDPNGIPVGQEFQVNVMREGNQTEPAIAARGQGGFLVAWQGPGLDREDIFLRLIDPNGLPVTDEWLVNARTQGRQLYPCVTMGAGDSAIVAWESREIVDDVNRTSIYARVLDPNGASDHNETLVDSGVYNSRYPSVAADTMGRFIVTWMQERSSNTIMARRFDPNGMPAAEPFAVSKAGIASLTRPTVAMSSPGFFVIAWDGDPNRAGEDDIHARLYDSNDAPVGEPFMVNTIRSGAQQWPRVAMNDANEFVVVWEHESEDPNAALDIFARRFDGAGRPQGEPFQINTCTPGRQRSPDVAVADDGSLIVVWESEAQDGSNYGIFAERLPPPPPPAELTSEP